jgi:predicted dehydrogenase
MENTFNWGIIGLGRIAHKFAQDLRHIPGARLHAVAARDLGRAQDFGKQYQVTHAYGTYEEILNCPDLHAVYVATPHSSHAENTVMCMQGGMPVLCEKAFAVNARESAEMIAASRKHGTFLMEAFWTRFIPSTQYALDEIAKGSIGEIVGLKADFGFKPVFDPSSRLFDPQLAGGALLDIGVYPLFLALLLLGKPEEIMAKAYLGPTGVDEDTAFILRHQRGVLSHLHASIRMGTKTEAYIYGNEGTILLHSRFHEPCKVSILKEGQRPEVVQFDSPGFGYHYEASEAMRCIRLGLKESLSLPLVFSQTMMEVLDEIRRHIGLVYPNDSLK